MLLLNLKVTLFRLMHLVHTIFCYYPKFLWIDIQLACQYIGQNPYHLTTDYGETPLRTLDQMAMKFGLLSKDRIIELGCGTGRTSFWLERFVGCRVIAVDTCSAFIEKAKKLSSTVEFRQEDILATKLDADFLYFYGTSFSDAFIKKFASRCSNQKVITVSFPLSDYDERFVVEKKMQGSFPWGKADIYLNYRVDAQDPAPSEEFAPKCRSNF